MLRLIVCVDFETTDDLVKAYSELYAGMTKSGLEWESSDEWYGEEDNFPGDPQVLEKARMKFFEKRKDVVEG